MRFPALKRLGVLTFLAGCLHASMTAATTDAPLRLVVVVTVDQLRGDAPLRFRDRLGEDGLRRLMEEGLYYANAQYRHASTFTAVGHAVIFTGLEPRDHGIVGNQWGARHAGGVRGVDPVGSCPRESVGDAPGPGHLASPTFGDRLLSEGKVGRTFSVSLKDHAAIIQGGREGLAIWYSASRGRFVSSACYGPLDPQLDNLLCAVNGGAVTEDGACEGRPPAERYRGETWQPAFPIETYAGYCAGDDPDCVSAAAWRTSGLFDDEGRLAPGFPYEPSNAAAGAEAPDRYLYSAIRQTPFGDELTVEAVRRLVRARGIGQAELPDLLAISLSCTDYIGHAFGPDSLEYEDNLYRLDRTLASLLSFLDDTVGEGRYVVALTSDHGIDSIPGHRQALGYPAGKLPDGPAFTARMNDVLRGRLQLDADPLLGFLAPGFFLDHWVLDAAGLSHEEVQRALAEELIRVPGVFRAYTRAEIEALGRQLSDDRMLRRVQRSFFPARSPDVVVVQAPHWYLNTSTRSAAMHGSPYPYDAHVPLILWGRRIPCRAVHRQVAPGDLAEALYRYVSGGGGATRLHEVAGGRDRNR